ncbi:penicillin-binding transpeptidase domain-containing protein [uncultured Limosilactobacillus sp.]|uniref:penicillin-binding transpeptidase domain-containing protein n=1 Tax=uncultured Limosilactobacillus sp. TaxID=2837629 RepID=UPI0025FF912C|nr:penicillin-binding transpeptidase domain-containing protein [uncultured Limosilactobacillus sp.]
MKSPDQQKRTMNSKGQRDHKQFGKWLCIVVAGLFLLFIVRFAYIAIFKDVKNHDLATAAQQRYTHSRVITAQRGNIYDANNNLLARNTSKYTVYAVLDKNQKTLNGKPLYVTNKKRTARVLAEYLDVSEKKVYRALTPKKKLYQVQFGTAGSNISVSKMEEIKARHLTGIHFTKTPARQYPEGEFARQLLGGTAVKTNPQTGQSKLVGQIGLEQYFNKQLSGKDGLKKSENDVYGYQLSDSPQKGHAVKNGDNVYLTLNNTVQHQLENLVTSADKAAKPEAMTAVVMEAKTGKIIAATQRPTMTSKKPAWTNALIQDTYEPGSTMKVIALASAIDSGNFNPNATYKSGTWSMGGGKITDWNTSGWGNITFREAFYRSSNVGFAHIEQNMGASTWKKYLKDFGFLKPTKVYGMSGESSGATTFKGALEQANTSFGQGITVNTMQMMQAFTAVANNGHMMRPYIVQKITNNNGNTIKTVQPKQVGKPISSSAAKETRKYMQGVIYDKVGTGQLYKVKGYRIAGKTGTAQIGGAHGYEQGSNNYIYSFVGFAPAKNPKYILYITMRKPTSTNGPAEKTMAGITTPLIKTLLDKQKSKQTKKQGVVKVKNVVGQSTKDAQEKLTRDHLQVTVVGSGKKVRQQSLLPGTAVVINNRIIILTDGKVKMPNITDWSQSDVSQLAQMLNLNLNSSGSGFATEQSIKENQTVKSGQQLTVKFEEK